MAVEGTKDIIPGLKAAASLTTKQYCIMKMSADFTVNICSGATDCPVGILDNAPASGDAAAVVYKGVAKVVLGDTVAVGDRVCTDASGHAVKATEGTDATHYVIGQMLEAGASGDIRSVLLGGTPHRAA